MSREKGALAALQDEIDSAFLYEGAAALEERPELAEVYRRMAADERRHAERLRAALGESAPPVTRPSRRARLLATLARRFGAGFILPTLVAREDADRRAYGASSATAAEAGDEAAHARLLRLAASASPGGLEGSAVARLEGRHRAVGGNALRAAVLGANDGLVSNLSLVMGVAGAEMSERGILITGLAGLLAGAGSMALGEWLSVQSSRELYQRQLDIEREELRVAPAEEAEEIALILRAKGLPEAAAIDAARRMIAEPERAVDTMAREELGFDPEELGGSAWVAAATSFVLFAIGAIVPVAPFTLWSGPLAIAVSVGASAVALFGIGSAITLLTGRGVLFSGTRQLLIGLAAAALTWAIGRWIGVSLAG